MTPAERLMHAKVRVAHSLIARDGARGEFQRALGAPPETMAEDEREEAAQRVYDKAKRKHEKLLDELAADPDVRSYMSPWMLDFHGNQPVHHTATALAADPEAMERAIQADVSEFARTIRDWIHQNGVNITDSGSGMGGWDLGALCTDYEAATLCRAAQDELRQYLDSGALTISLHFWGWRFRSLATVKDAIDFLKKQES